MTGNGKSRKRIGLVAATTVVLTACLVLLLPAFGGNGAPPRTVGDDVVVAGSGFAGAGELDSVRADASGLSLAPGSRQGTFVSAPVKADYDFNALGLHWLADGDGASVKAAVRFSRDGKEWQDWIPVVADPYGGPDRRGDTPSAGETIGMLAFADRARYFQYRLEFDAGTSGEAPRIERLTASYIDAKGYHESPLSPAAVWRGVQWALEPPQASAQPAIISRAQWGANEDYMTWEPEYEIPRKIIVHHTVTSNYDPDPAATVRSIYYYHAVSLGWGDIGYNFLIDRDGRIYEGRYGGNAVVGGHAYGWNYGSVGVAILGDYSSSDMTAASYSALVSLAQWKSNLNRIDPRGNDSMNGVTLPNYLGHRDVGSTSCPGNGVYQHLPSLRADVVYSPVPIDEPIYSKWEALHGAPGGAVNLQYPVTGGVAQDFAFGRIVWDNDAGAGYWLLGGILARYDGLGAYDGFLGMPTSDEYDIGGGRANNFQGGRIYWSPDTDVHVVYGGILAKYVAEGEVGRIGFPVTDEYDAPGAAGARETDFQYGRIYWSQDAGAHIMYGAILGKYLALGGPGLLGVPTSDEYDMPGVAGGRQTDFAGGRIYWTAATDARAVYGSIYDKYLDEGGPTGAFGLPVSDVYSAGPNGSAQDFQGAVFTDHTTAGAHVVYGAIKSKYLEMGGPAGVFGPALTDERDADGVAGARESDFEHGRVYWSAATGAHAVYGAILQTYLAGGGSATYGLPLGDEFSIEGVPDGRESDFQLARIYYHPATGAHEVYGAIYSKWMEFGGPAGGLGMPMTGEYDAPGGGRENDFQYGRVYWSAATGAHAVYGAILQKYLEIGASASSLGLPTSDEYAYGAGRRSDFQGGYIYWDAATGAHVVGNGAVTVTADSAYEVSSGSGALLGTVAAGQEVSVSYSGGVYTVLGPGVSYSGGDYVRLSPATAGGIMQVTSYHDVPAWNPSLDDNRFRGTIEVRYSPVSDRVWVINELPLELYLRGVAETSSGSPAEFLKAMSVAARGYALYHVNNGGKYYEHGQDIFHLKNSRNGNGDDQVYKGYGLEARFPDLTAAVDATSGQVVTYGGALAITTYFSNSDGRTRSAQEAWGVDYWPWLQSVPDPDCEGMTLNGHGVGLSGYGALKRAERGDGYQAILTYYYTGTAVQAMDTNKNIRVAIYSP